MRVEVITGFPPGSPNIAAYEVESFADLPAVGDLIVVGAGSYDVKARALQPGPPQIAYLTVTPRG